MENNTMKFLAYEGMVKVTCVDTLKLVQKAKEIHKLSKTTSKIMSNVLTIGAILGADLKNEIDNLTIQIKPSGPVGTIVCVIKKGAKVKGYIQVPDIEVPPTLEGKIDEKAVIGDHGTLYIIKDIGLKEPYVGITELINGDIVNSLVGYYAKSEQIPTVLSTGMLFNEKGDIKCSGGYIIQLMPDATKEVIDKIEKAVQSAPTITQMIEQGYDLVKIAKTITGDNDIMMMLGTIENEYTCDCSRDRMEKGLISLGKKELQEMIDENKSVNTKCHFCNNNYEFTIEDIKQLLKQA